MATGEELRTMLEDIVGKVTEDWDKRIGHLFERNQSRVEEIRDLRTRVARLERIIERIGNVALQEKP